MKTKLVNPIVSLCRFFTGRALLAVVCLTTLSARAGSSSLVIAEVYGGGGNSGATYKNDFIVIFNRSASSVDVNGWSVQYASASGSTWAGTTLASAIKQIPAGGYFLVQEAAGTGGTTDLPTPDATGSIAMSGSAGKVALCNSTTPLTGTCPTGGSIVDFVGFGGANCYEGSGPTPVLSNTTSAQRGNGGCTDSDVNVNDFTTGSPTPRNSGFASNVCGNQPPTITGLVNVSIPANTNTGPRAFTVNDQETPAGSLTVTATSANPTLVPNSPTYLTLANLGGGSRTLQVTPASGQQGTAAIEVVVTDGNSLTGTNSFTITVGAPTIAAIPNQTSPSNTVTGPVAFWVNDNETPPGNLVVTATSSDQAVLPDANIGIQNLGGTNRTITLTNIGPGVATVTVTVHDDPFDISSTFKLSSSPHLGVILADEFSYADGSIITNSGFFWDAHSGATGQTQVINGKLNLNNTASEDINAYFTNALAAPILSNSGVILYSSFTVNLSALPTSGPGEYFAHFKEFQNFYHARIFAITSGAASGKFRMAIANGAGTPSAVFPADFDLNTNLVVISRYNSATAESTLWVDPTSESSTSVSPTDFDVPFSIYSYAFRQSSGIGTMTVDNLKIGTAFSDVFTAAAPIKITKISVSAGTVTINFDAGAGDSASGFALLGSGTVNGVYSGPVAGSSVSGVSSGKFQATAPTSGTVQFYRIKRI